MLILARAITALIYLWLAGALCVVGVAIGGLAPGGVSVGLTWVDWLGVAGFVLGPPVVLWGGVRVGWWVGTGR